jgi:hypothetical protein
VKRLALSLLLALASQPPTGWDGTNPFKCVLQNAAFEPTGPDPAADPYCVEFDKRHQSVVDGGVVQFLSLEPARVAAATDKCFYFQSDHWRGSVVQEDGSTKTYEWDGHYFFDKAHAEGGVWVTNFNVNGQTGDPSSIPGMPQEFSRYFGPGTGGVITRNDVPADPNCAAKAAAQHDAIYASASGQAPGSGTAASACATPAGGFGSRHLGPVTLGATAERVQQRLGRPDELRRGWQLFCGGLWRVGFRGDRSGEPDDLGTAPVVALLTYDKRFAVRGVRVGSKVPRSARRVGKGLRAWRGLTLGIKRGRVRFLATVDRRAIHTRRGAALLLGRTYV